MRREQFQHLVPPAGQGALGKVALAFPAARVVEQQAGPAMGHGPVEHRAGLAAGHVAHVAGQEHQRRPVTGIVPKGDPAAIGQGMETGFAHPRIPALPRRISHA